MFIDEMMAQISGRDGFIAALDQSGGSTPGALRLYGVPDSAYSGDTEMFRRVHEMRVRIMTAPAFTGTKVIAAILFEGTMDGKVLGTTVPNYLWKERGVIPFLKIDKGLVAETDGVSAMRPMPRLDALLGRGARARHLRHQDRFRHQPAVQGGHRGGCEAAVRRCRTDRRVGAHPDH